MRNSKNYSLSNPIDNLSIQRKAIVIGNGFDLFFKLPTEYKNYKKFLERHLLEYKDCYDLFNFIVLETMGVATETFEWNNLEDSMQIWIEKYLNDEVTFPTNIDIYKILQQKNKSLTEWINEIREKHKNKIAKIKGLFKKVKDEIVIYSFNFTEDIYGWDLRSNLNSKNKSKIIGRQVHYLDNGSGKEIAFGGCFDNIKLRTAKRKKLFSIISEFNNKKSLSDDFKEWDINKKSKLILSLFCCKNLNINLNALNFFPDDERSACSFCGSNMFGEYFLRPDVLDRCPIEFTKDIYFLGFSFGQQDIKHYKSEINLFTYCNKNCGKVYSTHFPENNIGKTKMFSKILELVSIEKNNVLTYYELIKSIFCVDNECINDIIYTND